MALKSFSGSAAASHIGGGSSVYRGSPNYSPLAGYVSGSGSSARSVATTSRQNSGGAAGMADQLSSALNSIYNVTQQNNAWSAQQAALQRDWQVQQNKVAMDFNAAEAAKNRDWQQMMSDTAHQREIRDLQAAGLNPVLSAMGGNGAAVTSGATASGVTSAGAKGDTDTSFSQALVGLLGTMWSAQTQLESQRLTAQNNMAIAEKNNAMSETVARMYTDQAREASQLAAATGLKQSEISAAVSELVSRINANASFYASNISHQNAILNKEASEIVAKLHVGAQDRQTALNLLSNLARTGLDFYAALRGQNISAQTGRDVAQMYTDAERYGIDVGAETSKRGQNLGTLNEIIRGLFNVGSSYVGAKNRSGNTYNFNR